MILVLNVDYTPLSVTSFKRGFRLVYKKKAEVVESEKNNPVLTDNKDFKRPTVIRLLKYVYFPYKKVTLSRYNVYRRDDYTCVYCGSKDNLTLDHVLPKSRGGKNIWTNLVTCCGDCNFRKGNRTPEEMGMAMSYKAFLPNHLFFINKMHKMNSDWKPYMMGVE